MRPVNKVAKLLEMLHSNNGDSIKEFVSTLSAEDILDSLYEGQTVLSLLVESLFPMSESQDRGVSGSIVDTVASFSRGLSALVRAYFPAESENERSSGSQQSDVAHPESSTGKRQCNKSVQADSIVADIAASIRIIAEKIEERRRVVELKEPEAYAAYLNAVTHYITRRCVSYEVCGGLRMASAANALALQYFVKSGDKAGQLLAMQPLKEFLIGFSRYSLDPYYDVYPVHFALSMSGGIHEDKFIKEIVTPLLQGVSREGRNESVEGCRMGAFPRTRDRAGNTLLGYALSSPYCSAKTVGTVLKTFPDLEADPEQEGSLSLVELYVNNIPRYGMYCSMLDAYKDYAGERTSVARGFQAALRADRMSALREATSANKALQDKMLYPSREAINRFDRILGVLCGKDRKINAARKADFSKGLGNSHKMCVMEILKSYKEFLDEIRNAAKENSCENDVFLAQNVWRMVVTASIGQKIGAQAAADEVIGVLLQDTGYVRRLGITAARARKTASCKEARISNSQLQERGVADGWEHDAGFSCSINRFFGATCAMGKSAAEHFETFGKYSEMVFGAGHEIREKNRISEKVATNVVHCVAIGLPLVMVATNIALLVYESSTLKILLINTLCALASFLTFAFVYEMDKDQRAVDRSIGLMERGLKKYVKDVYSGCSVDTLFEVGNVLCDGEPEEVVAVHEEKGQHSSESAPRVPAPSARQGVGDVITKVASWVHSVRVAPQEARVFAGGECRI